MHGEHSMVFPWLQVILEAKETYGLSSGKLQYTNAIATSEAKKMRPNAMNGPVLLSTFCATDFESEEKKNFVLSEMREKTKY